MLFTQPRAESCHQWVAYFARDTVSLRTAVISSLLWSDAPSTVGVIVAGRRRSNSDLGSLILARLRDREFSQK
jgi:hypothetical protein